MDADLVAVIGDGAHFLGMQQRGDRGIEETRRDRLALQQLADARHRLAVAVLALADPHRAFVAITQRDRFVIGIEADRHRAARAVGPRLRLHAAAGAGAADDAPPRRLGPLPGFAFGMLGSDRSWAALLSGLHRARQRAMLRREHSEWERGHAGNRCRAADRRGHAGALRPPDAQPGRGAASRHRARRAAQSRTQRVRRAEPARDRGRHRKRDALARRPPARAAGRRAVHGEGPGRSRRLPDTPRQPHHRRRRRCRTTRPPWSD